MNLKPINPEIALTQPLYRAFAKQSIDTKLFNIFKTQLTRLLNNNNDSESEEFHKNLFSYFLTETYYKDKNFINTNNRKDLVIHGTIKPESPVNVIIEAKRRANKSEMMSLNDINSKALQELAYYYLDDRITKNNLDIKHIIATNNYEWFIFDARDFEKHFARDTEFVKHYQDFKNKKLAGTDTQFFYDDIAKQHIENITEQIEFVHFDIQDYRDSLENPTEENQTKLTALYKIFAPEYLLKKTIANDSNTLNKDFYQELLHILGLTETKLGGKKLIQRKQDGERDSGAILENTIAKLESTWHNARGIDKKSFGETKDEQMFGVSLELSITWINRILFLKLLEAQLVSYHKGNKDYKFLSTSEIPNFATLEALFFDVLAKPMNERSDKAKSKFTNIPYLNSSLFDLTELEYSAIRISNLPDDETMPIHSATVLKDSAGNKKTGKLPALQYLFEFLDSYDFGSEDTGGLKEQSKTIINASVLGLIFEKINGYKDGSFFTPGFITEYMCRETIRKAVVQKFNEAKGWDCKDFLALCNERKDIEEANAIVNSIKICDPAVGSGHFLVSALNEMIVIKHELEILRDKNGKLLRNYDIKVVNDELLVYDPDNHQLFEYNFQIPENRRIQETLFHEKQTIIENCLFGVDINPNSVKICRLRLWIELLKNAYYKDDKGIELETLPNIDINIKCGNSLISRFDIDADISKALKKSKWNIDSYRIAVDTYRNAKTKDEKYEMDELINEIKSDFRSEISNNDPKAKKLYNIKGDIETMLGQTSMFDMSKKEKADWDKKMKKFTSEANKLEAEIEDIKNNKIYTNAFEWRFEFPEVLNDNGDFVGFDIVIGNPPYISAPAMVKNNPQMRKAIINTKRYSTLHQKWDLYIPFMELGLQLLTNKGTFSMIVPYPLTNQIYGMKLRELIVNQYDLKEIVDLNGTKIFENATVSNCIPFISKTQPNGYCHVSKLNEHGQIQSEFIKSYSELVQDERTLVWNLTNEKRDTTRHSDMNVLGDYCYISVGMVINADEKTAKGEFVKDDLIRNSYDEIHCRKYIEAKDIEKYNIKRIRYLEYNTERCPDKLRRPTFRELYEKPKLLMNCLGGFCIAMDSNDHFLHNHSLYCSVLWKDLEGVENKSISASVKRYSNYTRKEMLEHSKTIDLRYLLGVLNSKYTSVLLSNLRAGDYHIYPEHIRNIPIPKITSKQQQPFISLVDKILAAKAANPNTDTSTQEAEIDRLVYELYGLTEEEIAIVEGKEK